MIAIIDASLRGERTQPICTLSCVEDDMMISGNDKDIPFASSSNFQKKILNIASDLSRKTPQQAKSSKKPIYVVLCGRYIMYLSQQSSCTGVSVDSNFYQTLWSLPNPLEVKAFEKVWSKEDGCLDFEKTPFENKQGQLGAKKRKPGSMLGSKELRQLWKFAEESPVDPFTGTAVVYHHSSDCAKKGIPDVYSAMSTGDSTTPRGSVPAENGTTTGKGSSINVKSSKRPGDTSGSGDDDPNDEEGRKCLKDSDSKTPGATC